MFSRLAFFHTYISSKNRYTVIKYSLLLTIKIIRALLHNMWVYNKSTRMAGTCKSSIPCTAQHPWCVLWARCETASASEAQLSDPDFHRCIQQGTRMSVLLTEIQTYIHLVGDTHTQFTHTQTCVCTVKSAQDESVKRKRPGDQAQPAWVHERQILLQQPDLILWPGHSFSGRGKGCGCHLPGL